MQILVFILITSSLTFSTLSVVGQQRKLTLEEYSSSGVNKLTFYSAECAKASSLAEIDIVKQMPFLVLKSGLAPQAFASDTTFENTYGVFYKETGCVGPVQECVVLYNQRIFEYLMDTYGNRWMRTVRKDVVGFREWKKKRK
ncbi:hypothetical protein J7E24_05680 [Hymenobacter sp. ISL-91]|uniref:FEKKY domain-containing protein n=1 Tax=Hymenobacter sp. ISL-91 TaxID=2819151 RepID=UPI001BE5BC14|nr:hypothetical protein [Hymenobacter sp. ISL-91]MBT2557265.1 hypothetical protein [Hymenobacter sp. ISL-91]